MPLKPPVPPTPPTVDRGDVQPSTPKIDAHQFFDVPQMPFRESNGKVESVDENSVVKEKPVVEEKVVPITREVTNPEDMARDAVANGAGALTKRTVTRADDSKPADVPTQQAPVQSVAPVMPAVPSTNSTSYERGQAVLREFDEVDKSESFTTQTVSPYKKNSAHEGSHGGIFWIVTLIIVVAAAFVLAKKFLFTDKPKLRKSDLFKDADEKLQSTSKKFSAKPELEKASAVKPVTIPKKDDDSKGKRFEVRI